MRERDLREEDKEEGRGLGEGSSFLWGEIVEEGEEEEKNWKNELFWGTLTWALLLLVTLGPGARKTQGFLELGSWRGCS
jgi:hypothetical protein